MDSKSVAGLLNSRLPNSQCKLPPVPGKGIDWIKSILEKDVPRKDSANLQSNCNWKFIVDKMSIEKKQKPIKQKKKFLTRKQRKKLGFLKLPKTDWKYKDLHVIREMWKSYMAENLESVKKTPACTDTTWGSFSLTLAKSEFIGAEFTVIRSKVPSVVGMTGTVVLETRSTFQIVTPDSKLKLLLKEPSVFSFSLNKMKFVFFGKHVATRPADRSVKKIKLHMAPDL